MSKNAFPRLIIIRLSLFFVILAVISCGGRSSDTGSYKSTTVSYYADKFDGRKTASGETYRHSKMTGAHTSLSFGTRVEIVNIGNGKSVIITVNDRGPLKASRAFDISQGAFRRIANLNDGVVKVKYRILN